jgi:hypothetical protein
MSTPYVEEITGIIGVNFDVIHRVLKRKWKYNETIQ